MLKGKRYCPVLWGRRFSAYGMVRLAGSGEKRAALGALCGSIALGVIAAAAVPAAAQQRTATSPRGRAIFQVTSIAVQLVLRATNQAGRPVTNLRRSQIKILDNGRPGRIVSFRPAWGQRPPTAASGGGGRQPATTAGLLETRRAPLLGRRDTWGL